MKGIHFGSYWMGCNDIVYLMASDLASLVELTIVDTNIYSDVQSDWFVEDVTYNELRPIRWLNEDRVMSLVEKVRPDFIIVNSGGMSLTHKTIKRLNSINIITVGISLSDPDVFDGNGSIYSKYYDIFYTNSLFSQMNMYAADVNIHLLPFAASIKLHKPIADIKKIYDVVIVGHARPDRIDVVNSLQNRFKVGLFGNGWGIDRPVVFGEEHVKAINSGKIYISFAETVAGYVNVKIGLFEAIACKVCAFTKVFPEMERYFKYGVDLVGYTDNQLLVEAIDYYLSNEKHLEWVTTNGYERLLKEHTWISRWKNVLKDIIDIKMKNIK